MNGFQVPDGWSQQAYKFCLDDGERADPVEASHLGARRFAFNFGRRLVTDQLHARNAYRVLALRQGASANDADKWAQTMVTIPWSTAEMRRIWNDTKDLITASNDGEYKAAVENICAREVLEVLALRQGAHTIEARSYSDHVIPSVGWWKENSKEAYSSGFEAASLALKNYFDSRNGTRKGPAVGWPKPKARYRGRASVSFTTEAMGIVDRHHIKLPVIGVRRTKEPTDKLRLRLEDESAKILRATLCEEGGQRFVSFNVIVKREPSMPATCSVSGTDVGIAHLATSSDGHVVENPRAEKQVRQTINRYQRKMDRQHRTNSAACFNADGTHIAGRCLWNVRSKRSKQTQARLRRAHAKAANIRKDRIHKEPHRLASTYSVNVVEDLSASGMIARGRSKRGAQADSVLAELRRQLSYKHACLGGTLLLASRWYPSSKMCSACKTVNHDLKRSERVFKCPKCDLEIDRDLNAAYNLQSLAELACVVVLYRLSTGEPVEGSKLPVRPYGWEKKDLKKQDTCSSRGCARAGGPRADGGGRKTARCTMAGDRPFDREAVVATGSVDHVDGLSPSPKKAVV
ncbi:MAG: RNA-guided endonuclease InsQ/TnpB family protein [Acidimicrobiales bacterium]